jgi:hypothetical protein
VQRIEVSPFFKFAQTQNLNPINPLARIFKVTDDSIREQMLIPINLKHINRERYQRNTIDKEHTIPQGSVVFFTPSVVPYQKLPLELHKFDYVY